MAMPERRPLKSRSNPAFIAIAASLTRAGARPDGISFASMVFATLAGSAFLGTGFTDGWERIVLWIAAAAGIQLRLACNLLDGMVAVEGGRKSPVGPLWNEIPDRYSDAVILVGAGYALGGLELLGWIAALLAVLTAYIRAMGAASGCGEHFEGILSKPKRMATMTVASLAAIIVPAFPWMTAALAVVALGSLITCGQRLRNIARELKGRNV
jgi:phosphatidylglycerophosphate synthase